jgi:glyoxylase-like metal-dependent hydrolase (beta-lactamase superfamily II)
MFHKVIGNPQMKALEIPIHKIRLGLCNTYLIRGKEGAVLVDAGQSGWKKAFFRYLKTRGMAPEDIRLIVITHVHFDHVGNLKALAERCGCPVAIHSNEAHLLRQGEVVHPTGTNLFGNVAASLGRGLAPFLKFAAVKPDIIVAEELSLEQFGVSGKIISTPGHTPGSLSVLLPNGTACVGDLAANHYPGCIGPIVPPFADNMNTLFDSWDLLLRAGAKTICPGHGAPFSSEHLRTAMAAFKEQ